MIHLTGLELDALLQTARDNFVITDAAGLILRASSGCYAVYGVEPAQFLGRTVFELEREGILQPSVTALVLHSGTRTRVMQRTRSGHLVLATGVPVFDPGGRMARVVSSSYDLTDIQLLREEYERLQARSLDPDGPEKAVDEVGEVGGILYRSRAMEELIRLVRRVAESDATVLFLGESGVGKTVLARYLHDHSPRREGRFVEVNCGALPESLFESEMFGYQAGAFTGAARGGKPGLMELAHGGTLFLDEIGDLPASMQVKLLKVLEDRRIMRVGGTEERLIDVRILASTNRDLKKLMGREQFRADLYYRLSVFPISVPPLRARREDIPVLTQRCLDELNARYHRCKSLAPECLAYLRDETWAGNIRELRNTLERWWLASPGDRIGLPFETAGGADMPDGAPARQRERRDLNTALEQLERSLLTEARNCCRTTYEIAEYLNISQPTVVRKLRKYGLEAVTKASDRGRGIRGA